MKTDLSEIHRQVCTGDLCFYNVTWRLEQRSIFISTINLRIIIHIWYWGYTFQWSRASDDEVSVITIIYDK